MQTTFKRRACDGCRMCCKVLRIDEFEKPANLWCQHCTLTGCGIHGSHPRTCRDFFCLWIDDMSFGPDWKPDRCGFVMSRSASGKGLFINVDIETPNAWKAEPYYSALRRLASGARLGRYVTVSVGERCLVVFPEEEVDVCDLGPGCEIMVGYRDAPGARQPFAMVKIADGTIREFRGQVWRN